MMILFCAFISIIMLIAMFWAAIAKDTAFTVVYGVLALFLQATSLAMKTVELLGGGL